MRMIYSRKRILEKKHSNVEAYGCYLFSIYRLLPYDNQLESYAELFVRMQRSAIVNK